MPVGQVPSLTSNAASGTVTSAMVLNAALLGMIVLAASLFGNFTRPVGHLSAFWPANALLLGLMIRNPQLVTPIGPLAAIAGFIAGDLIAGSTLRETLWLTTANLFGIAAGYAFFSRIDPLDRRLRRPVSVLYLVLGAALAAAAAGIIGAIAHPILFGGTMVEGWIFWFVSEVVNYVAILPVVLTLPEISRDRAKWKAARRRLLEPGRMAPVLALLLSVAAGLVIGGPGAVAFPVLPLLWCALTYSIFTNAVLTLAFSVWTLLAISTGLLPLAFDNNDWSTVMSVRIGVTLMALAPITVASVMLARNELMDRLLYLASHDELTGLLNRHAFREKASRSLARLAASKRPATLLMLDIDRFKGINDNFGHATGDRVLKAFAGIVGTYVRDADAFGRLGGEEFAILFSDCASKEGEAIAERIRTAFAEASLTASDGRSLSTTVSIGSVVAHPAITDIELLLKGADEALYKGKQAGRNRVVHIELPISAT